MVVVVVVCLCVCACVCVCVCVWGGGGSFFTNSYCTYARMALYAFLSIDKTLDRTEDTQ